MLTGEEIRQWNVVYTSPDNKVYVIENESAYTVVHTYYGTRELVSESPKGGVQVENELQKVHDEAVAVYESMKDKEILNG